MINPKIASGAAAGAHRWRAFQKPNADLKSKVGACQRADGTYVHDISGVRIIQRTIFKNANLRTVSPIKDLDFIRLGDIPGESNATRAEDASFLIELDKRTEVECFTPASFLAKRKPAIMACMRHVVVLQPAFPRLVTDWAVNGVMKQKKLHRVPDRLVHALGLGADFHAFGNRGRARRHQLWSALDLNHAHPATALDADVRMITIPWNVDADLIGYLDHRLASFCFVGLAVNRELGHKELD